MDKVLSRKEIEESLSKIKNSLHIQYWRLSRIKSSVFGSFDVKSANFLFDIATHAEETIGLAQRELTTFSTLLQIAEDRERK